jgi:hypothetical protein
VAEGALLLVPEQGGDVDQAEPPVGQVTLGEGLSHLLEQTDEARPVRRQSPLQAPGRGVQAHGHGGDAGGSPGCEGVADRGGDAPDERVVAQPGEETRGLRFEDGNQGDFGGPERLLEPGACKRESVVASPEAWGGTEDDAVGGRMGRRWINGTTRR